MAELYGYAGKILRVDLTTKTITEIPSEQYLPQYIGGRGLAAKIYWDEVPPEVGPLDPDNRIILVTGTFHGTGIPGSSFSHLATKSPWLVPNSSYLMKSAGMGWGNELKYAGYDAIIIQGKAENLSYLWINDGKVEIMDGRFLRHIDTYLTRDMLWERHGKKARIACIGPAGENLVNNSAVFVDSGSAFGDGGFGAVMGSKNLKAVVVRGTGRIKLANPQKLLELNKAKIYRWSFKAGEERVIDGKVAVGSKPPLGEVWCSQVVGSGIGNDVKAGRARMKVRGCPGCCKPCRTSVKYNDNSVTAGVAQCMERLGPAIIEATYNRSGTYFNKISWDHSILIDKLGIAGFSPCGNMEWLAPASQAGILTEENTGLPFSKIGTPVFTEKLLRMVAFREGFGDILARHVVEIVEYITNHEEFGPDRAKIKDIALFDSLRGGSYTAQRGTNIKFPMHAISTTHADGIRQIVTLTDSQYGSEPESYWMRQPEGYQAVVAKKWLGSEKCVEPFYYGPEIAEGTMKHEEIVMETDCLGLCCLTTVPQGTMYYLPYVGHSSPTSPYGVPPFTKEDLVNYTPNWGTEYWSAVFGEDKTQEEIWKQCEMVRHIERAIYIRDGYTREDEHYPDWFHQREYEGKIECPKEEFEQLLEMYYQARGWDVVTGWPTRAKYEELGLNDVADELETLGKLPA